MIAQTIRGVRRIAPLLDPAVEDLTLFACAIEDAGALAGLSALRRLRVIACTVDDVAALVAAPIELLELSWSAIEDATPLLASQSLRTLRGYGVPWDRQSYDITLYEWRLGDHGHARPPAIETSRRAEWRIARALFEKTGACYGTMPTRLATLVRGDVLVEGYPEQMLPALATCATWDEAAATGFRRGALAAADPTTFAAPWLSGTDADAREWIGQDPALARFVARFADQTFWRESAAMQAERSKWIGVDVPPALARLRRDVLAGVRPDEPYLRVQVDGFDRPTPFDGDETWFTFGLLGFRNAERRELLDPLDLYPIGDSCAEAGYLELAVRRTGDDPTVYAYREQSLWHAHSEHAPLAPLVFPAFESVASLLGHVVAFAVDDDVYTG